MNKTTYIIDRVESVPYAQTVYNSRAPTDDSIRLFGEMKDKAYASILITIRPENNDMKIASIVYRDHQYMDIICRYRMELNGKIIEDEVKVKDYGYLTERLVIETIYKSASKHIAEALCRSLELPQQL